MQSGRQCIPLPNHCALLTSGFQDGRRGSQATGSCKAARFGGRRYRTGFFVCSASRFTTFQGKLKVVVDSVYGFEDALGAYERIMTSRATGKVVVKVDGSL
jgi:hypothetical protein